MIAKLWIELRSSLWFVPTVLVFFAAGLALALVEVDTVFDGYLTHEKLRPLLNAGAEGARGMLTAIASSMITVAGVAFSVTIVTLSLASTQYTPRILRNFMRDRANQFTLGVFVAIYTYCLVVLRTIGGANDGRVDEAFVPLLAVAFAMLLALLSIGCLIFFIHHVAASIQASTILKAITDDTLRAIHDLFPNPISTDVALEPKAPVELESATWHPILATEYGYLQHLDIQELLKFGETHETFLRLERSAGDFVTALAPLISSTRALTEHQQHCLLRLLAIGDFRTIEQDPTFGLRQIVDIAMKALSPGINDTSTAVSCLDYLGAILSSIIHRQIGDSFATAGKFGLLTPALSFEEFVGISFNEIRLSAAGNVTILLQMLQVLCRIASGCHTADRRQSLIEVARQTLELANRTVPAPHDRGRINQKLEILRQALHTDALPPLG